VISKAGGKKLKAGSPRFGGTRQRVYGGLLLFVVAAGVPMAAVPSLRNRLLARYYELKTAISGEIRPAMVQAGANQEPFPAEYERPALPSAAQVFKIPTAPVPYGALKKEETPARGAPRRTLRIPPAGEPLPPADEGDTSGAQSQSAPASDAVDQPKYRQGTMEREAYDLLLKSGATIAGLVQGSNPSLQFSSWDAAGRGGDMYWVRLIFRQEGKPEAEYIWQVQLESKQVTPLNYNARTLQ
jgi:hypothetical protein